MAWFYVVSEEAAPIFQRIIATGVGPGTVVTIPDEDFEVLRDGMVALPVHILNKSKIIKSHLVVPTAS